MKLLFHSNAPYAPTGYGNQTGLFAPLLAEHHDLAISAFYGLEGARIRWQDIPIFPGLGGEFGNGYLADHARHHFKDEPGLVLTLLDVWVLNAEMASRLDMASWVPVDHDPAPPAVIDFFRRSGSIPIAMSRFGQEQLREFDPLYVPHGVDIDIYKPHDRDEVREVVGVPQDAFLIGMVAANKGRPSRKGFQQAFEAFREIRSRHENAYLYLHTTLNPEISQGENLPGLLDSLQIPADAVLLADQYRMLFDPYSPQLMAKIYSSFDVLLNPAMGEGFGIPVLEAQACGVPVIVTDFSAMKEVCGAGWKVACRPSWTPQNSWQALPDVADIAQSLEECIKLPAAARAQVSQKARKHALGYSSKRILTEHFLPALEEVGERLDRRRPLQPIGKEKVAA